ncbi:MAG TPA: 3-hydroxybutyrate oligomer hydrolase family protein, partial [Burkholderiaceae bacterium]|nr:3-hydroxybutyrate oligomer hydrolase family protein [Burkholderiaceae bacterium]
MWSGKVSSELTLLALAVGAVTLVACNGEGINRKPDFIGTVAHIEYDGVSDDLLSAGLGKTGLAGAAPAFANPTSPSAAELRRAA